MRRLACTLLALTLAATLAGCGQKGPLYMPDDERAAERYDPTGQEDASEDTGQDDATASEDET
ncbi:Predicted small lipoprotein YifL [Halomonas korlensis]|uniref:Predicted small lipoprotein YifL n=1 Tax=Halomonas korlensis TaxID=463301 RepID=A0A1I7K5Z2_9GAMM|nr:Predicted small lipoprotein YifL [Halomonas korlensis]